MRKVFSLLLILLLLVLFAVPIMAGGQKEGGKASNSHFGPD